MIRSRRLKTIHKKLPMFDDQMLECLVEWSAHFKIKNVTNELLIIEKWMLKIDKTLYDLSIQDYYNIYQRKIDRHNNLKLLNKRIDCIDLSLVEVFIQDKQKAEEIYRTLCIHKTKPMIKTLQENPELRMAGDLQSCIKRAGDVVLGKKLYEEINYKKGYSVSIRKFIDDGYSVEDAKKLLSERQRTFYYEKCVATHGELKGKQIWQERQDKWQKTLKSKSPEEIKTINSKKGISVSGCMARGHTLEESIEIVGSYYHTGAKYSKEQYDVFNQMFPKIILKNARYADKEFYLYDHEFRCRRFYDFMYNGVIVEYHGVAFHPNTKTFSKNKIESWKHAYTKENSETVIARDRHRKALAIRNGFYFFEIYSDMTNEEIVDIANQSKLIMLSRSNRK